MKLPDWANESANAAKAAAAADEWDLALEILHAAEMELFGRLRARDDEDTDMFQRRVRDAASYLRAERRSNAFTDEQAFEYLRKRQSGPMRRLSVYDAYGADVGSHVRSANLFTNANIGYHHLTNLRVAGQLTAQDDVSVVSRVRARAAHAESVGPAEYVEITVSRRSLGQFFVQDLLREPASVFWIVQPQANVSVRVDNRAVGGGVVWIYLEGWSRGAP